MREFWKKTSLLYKLIAVILTVVMVGTTLYFHFDRKYSAKAEGEIRAFLAYLPNDNDTEKYGADGWIEVINDSSVGKGEREFAYFIAVPNSENLEKIWYTTDGTAVNVENATQIICSSDQSSELSGFVGYKVYKIPINDYDSAASLKWKYTFPSATAVDGNVVTFNKQTSCNTMTVKHGEDAVSDNAMGYYNNGDTLTVEITTTGTLTALTVLDDNVTVDPQTNDKLTLVTNEQSLVNTYTYTYTFSGDVNKTYTEKVISATTTISESIPIPSITYATLIYDQTKPVLKPTVSGLVFDPSKWYKSDELKVEISSGAGDSESPIKEIELSPTNGTCEGGDDVVTFKANSSGTATLNVGVTDNSENQTSESYSFKVDKELPEVSSIDVSEKNPDGTNYYVKLNDDNEVIIRGTVNEAFSGIADAGGLMFHAKKDGAGGHGDNHSYTLESGNNSYNFSINFGAIVGSNVDFSNHNNDATYEVWVVPTDNAGNVGSESDHITFILDTTAPELTGTYNTDVVIQRHSITSTITDETADGYWENVPATEIANGKHLVNKAKYNRIRYKVKATDTNFGTLKFVSGETYDTKSTDDWYYCEVPLNDITKASAVEYSVTATDKALNETTAVLPSLQEVNSDLTVSLVSIKHNGTDVEGITSLSDLKTYFANNSDVSGFYNITVKATSGYTVKEITLKQDTSDYKKYHSGENGGLTNSADTVTGIFTTNEVTFAIPAVIANVVLEDMSLYVDDSNPTPGPVTVDIGDLVCDNTAPIVINMGTLDAAKWYQEYNLQVDVQSGPNVSDSAVESALKTASYSIDGSAATGIDIPAGKKVVSKTISIPESTSTLGTKVVFEAKDKATNSVDTTTNEFYVKVDKTAPAVAPITVNGEVVDESVVLAGTPQLASTVTDNLTINNYHVSVLYNGAAYADYPVLVQKDETSESIDYTLQQFLGDKALNDGRYDVSVTAWDKSGRVSNVSSTAFIVDNTIPVVTADIVGGTSGKSNGFYNTDVTVRLTCKDNNFNPAAMVVTDNGSAVNADWKVGTDVYYADIVLSSEGMHNIIVSGNDKVGNAAVSKQVVFTIDKTAPTVSLLVNGGQVYSESRGTLNLMGPLTLTASITDTNEDAGDLRIQVIKTIPDTATTTSDYMSTGDRTFTFADEADYTINIFAVDKANNQGPTRTISFRVDSTAPQLTITGANGGTSASATTVSFNLNEAFWSDAKGTVEIYRKAGDGVDEVLFKTLTLTPTQKNYSLSEVLTETGIYRFEFNANDKVGHTATTSQKVTVDRNKPEITLTGVNNYDSTDGEVSISAVIKDEFYANKKVSISGTRIDANGKKTAVSFSPFAATANPTTISDTFKEEGIYDITITSTDIAGNVSTSSVHFTIDTSKPNIGDLSDFDGKTFNKKTFNELNLDELELDNLVSDLTVCQIRMYLNGSEYDGIDEIEDGSYTLLITAEDELGHKSEKTATFVIDTKDPVFIVTGVEDGEVKNEDYSIEVSLQLDEDKLEQVTLNGKDITLKNNEASLNVTEKGEYELYMKATDEAGNEAEQTITFTFGEESVASAVSDAVEKAASHWWMWAVLAAAILAVGGFIFIVLKRRKED